jgi:DNA (cytosine-5)-methyltransferase 1
MTHASLFSGIGGFDLAAEWMGWENVFHCEWNEFGKRVLKYYWPKAISYHDITKTDFTIHRGTIDVLTGGFPCQPFSVAGKQLGNKDERHLWPEMLRAITEIKPRFVVGENVRGIVSWNGGMVFEQVQNDLETAGYKILPFIIPAAGVGAPHKRDRAWFVAYASGLCLQGQHIRQGEIEPWGGSWAGDWKEVASEIHRLDDGISGGLDGITFSDWRNESIKAYGNAIVPQIAYQIFQAIEAYERILA